MGEKQLMKGNEAFATAAINAGCRYYFGYPITPQNEVPEFMSRELAKHGGAFIQAESELGAVNMAYGAAAAGGRVIFSRHCTYAGIDFTIGIGRTANSYYQRNERWPRYRINTTVTG